MGCHAFPPGFKYYQILARRNKLNGQSGQHQRRISTPIMNRSSMPAIAFPELSLLSGSLLVNKGIVNPGLIVNPCAVLLSLRIAKIVEHWEHC